MSGTRVCGHCGGAWDSSHAAYAYPALCPTCEDLYARLDGIKGRLADLMCAARGGAIEALLDVPSTAEAWVALCTEIHLRSAPRPDSTTASAA